MAITMRRGLQADFDASKLLPGEWAVAIDNDTSKQVVWMCFAPGVVKRMGTYEDFVGIYLPKMLELHDESKGYASSAKVSESNAKNYMESAKTSEQLAKHYMESAFAGTPEGYQALVEQVGLMDIAKSTERTIHNTKPGGYRLLELLGNTIQNGVPSLATPFPLLSTGECVNIMSGLYQVNKGDVYATNEDYICNKNPIPCKGGDTIGIVSSQNAWRYILFYNENGFISSVDLGTTNTSATAPSGATYFNFDVAGTLNTAGNIVLTINGKYVVPIKTHGGKNILGGLRFASALVDSGATSVFESNKRVSLAADTNSAKFSYANFKENTQYTFFLRGYNGNAGNLTATNLLIYYTDGSYSTLYFNASIDNINVVVSSANKTISKMAGYYEAGNAHFYYEDFGIMEGVRTLEDFEPYRETSAYILTSEPPRLGDIFYKENGLWMLERNVAEAVFDGSNDEGWNVANTSVSGKYRMYTDKGLGFTCVNNEIANIMCTSLIPTTADNVFNAWGGVSVNINGALVLYDENYNTSNVSLWKAYLQEKPMRIIYPLATPIIETLDTASQIALNSLETFNGVTHIEFDSRVQPLGIKGEVGTSQVGAYTLKSLNNSESNAVKIEDAISTMLLIGAQ